MEYKPKSRRRGINPPFGYFVSPVDSSVLLPDPKRLEALEYAFKMKAKYKTSIRDCCQWLHAQCGARLTPSGFMYAYRRWANKLNKEKCQQIAAKKRELLKQRNELIANTYSDFIVVTDDRPAVSALAHEKARKEEAKKKV